MLDCCWSSTVFTTLTCCNESYIMFFDQGLIGGIPAEMWCTRRSAPAGKARRKNISGIWRWFWEVEKNLWLIPLGKVLSYLIIPPVTWGFYYHPLFFGRFFISRHQELGENAEVLLSPGFWKPLVLISFNLSFHLLLPILEFSSVTFATW